MSLLVSRGNGACRPGRALLLGAEVIHLWPSPPCPPLIPRSHWSPTLVLPSSSGQLGRSPSLPALPTCQPRPSSQGGRVAPAFPANVGSLLSLQW